MTRYCLSNHLDHCIANGIQGCRRASPVRSRLVDAVLHALADRGDSHLEELIQVGTGNTQKAQSLEDRNAAVPGQFENPAGKRQQAQFAIEQQLRRIKLFANAIPAAAPRVE